IPLHLQAPNYSYTLSLPDFDLEEGRTLRLYDRFTEEYITLAKGTTYDFEVTDDPRTKGHRFDIVMGIEVITSIHPTNRRFQAYLLPNPAQEQVRISIQKPDNVATTNIRIVSMAGVEVRSEQINTATTELDINLSQLSKGIYLVEITHGTERIVKRLIVN
ncbi:T9SS type A sorting domain-containing protein, partial [Peijinzhouia sedimentorum]